MNLNELVSFFALLDLFFAFLDYRFLVLDQNFLNGLFLLQVFEGVVFLASPRYNFIVQPLLAFLLHHLSVLVLDLLLVLRLLLKLLVYEVVSVLYFDFQCRFFLLFLRVRRLLLKHFRLIEVV